MNECCEVWYGSSLESATMRGVFDQKWQIEFEYPRKFKFCPECGTILREPLRCGDCRFYFLCDEPDYMCVHPENLSYGGLLSTINWHGDINANNDCKWFERKEKADGI